MLLAIVLRQHLNYYEQEDTDVLALAQYTCALLACIVRLTPRTFSFDRRELIRKLILII